MFVMVVTVIMSHACHMIIMDLPIGNVCSGCYCCVTCVSHDNFAGFSASSLGSTPSVPDSVGVTPLRGISLDSVMSLPESTPATPPGGVTGDTPVRKPLGKEARVSLRGTKRTKSDEIVIKAGGDTRQAKRSKSESLSALKKVSQKWCIHMGRILNNNNNIFLLKLYELLDRGYCLSPQYPALSLTHTQLQ